MLSGETGGLGRDSCAKTGLYLRIEPGLLRKLRWALPPLRHDGCKERDDEARDRTGHTTGRCHTQLIRYECHTSFFVALTNLNSKVRSMPTRLDRA